ncbi:hypothetical protein NIES4074_50950 [Cylindrospermum sp. NIES-4074]|nr:hypothetical protein NIES4074_50950 [Cylindrospermum sp. NIES-4074]
MAQKNNILSELLSSSPNFLSQVIFGLLLTIILKMAGASLILGLFLGIMGGVVLGWITTATENSPQSSTVASSDGIDAGLKYWLFFMLGFVFFGYQAPMSIVLGGIAGLGGGWIIAWWKSKEETKTQLPAINIEEAEIQQPNERITRQQKRKPTRRYRRTSGTFNFRFWQR